MQSKETTYFDYALEREIWPHVEGPVVDRASDAFVGVMELLQCTETEMKQELCPHQTVTNLNALYSFIHPRKDF